MTKRFHFRIFTCFSVLLLGCVDPVAPEFEFKEGLVFVEGFASTAAGTSYVIINKSVTEFGVNTTVFEKGATVSFKNSDTGQTITLFEEEGAYAPPADFTVEVGERWELAITLIDGTQYKSSPETILNPVPISGITAAYNPELQFDEGVGEYQPGHLVSATFDDPEDQENFYYWTFRSFENLDICETCLDSILRNGECTNTDVPTPDFFSYVCDTDCWKIRFPESISIFDDKFSNGRTTSNLAVANMPLYTKENMVVELQQFTLTPAAYNYYQVLKDIVDNNSGFNAPPPAALIGNLVNANDEDDFVFGRFTAASASVTSIFIDRSTVEEDAIEPLVSANLEPTLLSPYPPPATISAPCTETRFRTAMRPEKWVD